MNHFLLPFMFMSGMQLRVNESMILIGRISKQESNQKLAFVCLINFFYLFLLIYDLIQTL
jgi:hypothetical protein